MSEVSRRGFLAPFACGGAAVPSDTPLSEFAPQDARPAGTHEVRPPPFKPETLRGLSPKPLLSHDENNDSGAVKNLNRVEKEIPQLPKDAPPFLVGALREREIRFRNSAALHELYFGNLGGDGKPTPAASLRG